MTRWSVLLALSLTAASCAYDDIPPRDGDPPRAALEVGPRYANAPRWSDYLEDRHAGALRALPLPSDADSCDGIEARDEHGWLEWTCDDHGAQVRIVAERLAPDVGLADLIDAEASPPRWRGN